jgi:hypothetical protein
LPLASSPKPLDWIPLDRTIRPPAGLKDLQQGWFWNLLLASFFDQSEMQGYLPITSQLWLIAGAHRRDLWEAHKSPVMAAFDVLKLEGGKEVLYFPPLIESIRKQRTRLRNRKSVDEEFSTNSQPSTEGAGVSPSTSQSGFDFDSKKPLQNQKPSNVRKTSKYKQADFDARDLRRLKEAADKFDRMRDASLGNNPHWMQDEKKVYEWLCQEAGITVERALRLESIQKKWPDKPKTLAAAGD